MSALPPKADMCTAVANVRYGLIADIGRMWSYRVSFGVRYVLWQPSHAYATARNCLRNASPSNGLVVDNFSASICNFLTFSVKSSHLYKTIGFAAVGDWVLPGGNC